MNKGSQSLIASPFYGVVDDGHDFYLGQICDAHIYHPQFVPHLLALNEQDYDPTDESKAKFTLKKIRGDAQNKHLPLKNLGLETDEFLYVVKGKKRPVVVLAKAAERTWTQSTKKTRAVYLCCPIYSIQKYHPQSFVIEAQAMKFDNLFYLPEDTSGLLKESMARFEMIQPVPSTCLMPFKNVSNQYVRLSEEVLLYFLNHLVKFLTGDGADSDIEGLSKIYGDDLIDALKKAQQNISAK